MTRTLPVTLLHAFLALAVGGCGNGDPEARTPSPAPVDPSPPAQTGAEDGPREPEPPSEPPDAGPPPLEVVPALGVGAESACLLGADGLVRCWGSQRFGQLGTSDLPARLGEKREGAAPVAGLEGAARLAVGAYHACVVRRDRRVACWGHGGYGQLGDGATEDRPTPVALEGASDAVAVTTGEGFTCVLDGAAHVACVGRNDHGQLGDGTFDTRRTLAPVPGLEGVAEIVAGRAHACARLGEGEIRCWGEAVDGQVGDGERGDDAGHRSTPTPVRSPGSLGALAAGGGHTCGVRDDGALVCWGRDDSRQIGGPRAGLAGSAQTTPVVVSRLREVTQVAAGARHTCARLSSGAVRCLGSNRRGQLGAGHRRQVRDAVTVEGLEGAVAVGAGVEFSCALLADARVMCWGDNGQGQLGAPDLVLSDVPVAVTGL